MKWIKERDALIAQTLAFVQSVAGKKDDVRPPDTSAAAPLLAGEDVAVRAATISFEPVRADLPPARVAAPPPQPLPTPAPRPGTDFRSEMQDRIANFRKHQERFEREREEYCAATLTKLRAAIRDSALPPPALK